MEFDNHDGRIKYYELMLERSLEKLPHFPLPDGYRYAFYQPGDRESWIDIEKSAKEFTSYEQGAEAWNRYYGGNESALLNRMVFIEDENGKKVATATAYYDVTDRDKSGDGWLHWVAVRREYQGKGLAKPLITHVLEIMRGFGHTHAKIPTQTTTWLACKVYLDLGFRPIPENAVHSREGWRIVKALTNHAALEAFDAASFDEIVGKVFNVTGPCIPELHYMVDIHSRLEEIKELVDDGAYFTVNRARQYGKTTTLTALQKFLDESYVVLYLDFQFLSQANFETEDAFVRAFARELLAAQKGEMPEETVKELRNIMSGSNYNCDLGSLFFILSDWCAVSDRPVVLIIDEVDSASNNQVFLDFLSQLRGYYIHRTTRASFQSVILAGVYDVKNMKSKIRSEDAHKVNSPWNIATDFEVIMSFSKEGIAGMLCQYESDHNTGMDIKAVAEMIYDYTSGYPFLVSRICKLIDEKVAGSEAFSALSLAWSEQGVLEAVRMLLFEKNTLFDSLIGKLYDYKNLKETVYDILFGGQRLMYNLDDPAIDIAAMFGFVKNSDGVLIIANRIFETRLYNYFLTVSDAAESKIYAAASDNKSQYIKNGRLDMERVMGRFIEHFDDIYGDQKSEFDEEEGRRRFLLYLKPIINGTGNYYIEAETRNARRMDIVVDYLGERFVIELKIWRGNSYHERGEKQLSEYLDYFNLKKGYMLSYNFNKKKEIGVKELHIGDQVLIEAVV